MAHWIITDLGFSGTYYRCSECGHSYIDLFDSRILAANLGRCPCCKSPLNDEEDEYIEDIKSTTTESYNVRIDTLLEYCSCLYKLNDCSSGGNLHIWLDDYNTSDEDVRFCLNECLANPDDEGSDLGVLICNRYLKLSAEEKELFNKMWKDGE